MNKKKEELLSFVELKHRTAYGTISKTQTHIMINKISKQIQSALMLDPKIMLSPLVSDSGDRRTLTFTLRKKTHKIVAEYQISYLNSVQNLKINGNPLCSFLVRCCTIRVATGVSAVKILIGSKDFNLYISTPSSIDDSYCEGFEDLNAFILTNQVFVKKELTKCLTT